MDRPVINPADVPCPFPESEPDQPDPLEAAIRKGYDEWSILSDCTPVEMCIARHVRPLLEEQVRKAYAEGIVWERSLNRAAVAEALEKQRNRVVNAMQEAIDNLRPVPTYPVPNVVDDLAAAIRALREPTP